MKTPSSSAGRRRFICAAVCEYVRAAEPMNARSIITMIYEANEVESIATDLVAVAEPSVLADADEQSAVVGEMFLVLLLIAQGFPHRAVPAQLQEPG